jgi:hypothetical protein
MYKMYSCNYNKVYDTENCDWKTIAGINRFRHYCWLLGSFLYAYAGFDHLLPSAPTNDLQILDCDRAFAELGGIDVPTYHSGWIGESGMLPGG